MNNYEKHMKKCIKLARKGEGKTSPNPLVGCVVLDKNGNEISTGFHAKCGEAHAEASALNKLKNGEAEDGTIIVSLEPCSHHGKTPPCAGLIIKHKLKTLVLGMKDPNPIVSGNGIKKCKKAGIEVIQGILEADAKKLNEVFIKNMTQKKVFVAIKTATTIDGKIATSCGDSKWITSTRARAEVQKIRNRYDAIMTTSSTIIKDNPSMTCRLKNGKNPVKIVLDRQLKTDFDSKIYEQGEKIYLIVDENTDEQKLITIPRHIEIIKCPVKKSKLDLKFLLKKLFDLGIRSVLVEAGGILNGELVSLGLVDKIYQFIAPKILADKEGINAYAGRCITKISDAIEFKIEKIKRFTPDLLIVLCK